MLKNSIGSYGKTMSERFPPVDRMADVLALFSKRMSLSFNLLLSEAQRTGSYGASRRKAAPTSPQLSWCNLQ